MFSRNGLFCSALCSVALATGGITAHAAGVPGQGTWETTLQARDLNGDGVVDAYYDTSLKISWLANANAAAGSPYDDGVSTTGNDADRFTDGRLTWQSALAWAANLNVSGITGWRLPTHADTGDLGCNFSFAGGTDCGYNVQTGSELAHMYYVTLGNLAYYTPVTGAPQQPPQPGWGLKNTANFVNLIASDYWYGQADPLRPTANSWTFYNYDGFQTTLSQSSPMHAWAVHDGDVGQLIPRNTLTFQGVTFTVKLVGNVFDVEIDAGSRSGDWAPAAYIDSIELRNIGTFANFTLGDSGAAWIASKANLKGGGCVTGKNASGACAQGTPLTLANDMHFTFSFDAGAKLDATAPYLTVRFLNAKMRKQGSMLAQPIPAVSP